MYEFNRALLISKQARQHQTHNIFEIPCQKQWSIWRRLCHHMIQTYSDFGPMMLYIFVTRIVWSVQKYTLLHDENPKYFKFYDY